MQARRHRSLLVSATIAGVVVMAAWFPASDLLHEHEQLAAATTELHRLDQGNHSLELKAAELKTASDIERIAQQQYGLVASGAQAYQVLPPSGTGNGVLPGITAASEPPTTASGSTASGSAASGSTASGSTASGSTSQATQMRSRSLRSTASGGFLGRVLQTLEFWR